MEELRSYDFFLILIIYQIIDYISDVFNYYLANEYTVTIKLY